MKAPVRTWPVRLTAAAEADFRHIVRRSHQQFGAIQARAYAQTLVRAIEALIGGPEVIGVRRRDDIAKGLMSLHVAREGRKGRHFLIFRVRRHGKTDTVEVLRLLHDAMDLARHLPPTAEG